MLKHKLMLPILAVIAGVAASAFTTAKSSYNGNSKDPSYYWFSPSGSYHDLNTQNVEMALTGCDNSTTILCENGYTSSQLKNPSDPSQGVKNGQTPADFINQHQ